MSHKNYYVNQIDSIAVMRVESFLSAMMTECQAVAAQICAGVNALWTRLKAHRGTSATRTTQDTTRPLCVAQRALWRVLGACCAAMCGAPATERGGADRKSQGGGGSFCSVYPLYLFLKTRQSALANCLEV